MTEENKIKYFYTLSVSKTRANPDYKKPDRYQRNYDEAVSPTVTEQALQTILTEEQWLALQESILKTFGTK